MHRPIRLSNNYVIYAQLFLNAFCIFVLSIIAKVRRIVNTILKTNLASSGHFENELALLCIDRRNRKRRVRRVFEIVASFCFE